MSEHKAEPYADIPLMAFFPGLPG